MNKFNTYIELTLVSNVSACTYVHMKLYERMCRSIHFLGTFTEYPYLKLNL
ncbi:hypothetical protein IMSAGC004_02195 [Bacteroidaceae bacterium]|nr:hypothetical protein IMSAGC004_02195 [Bacteroidaceae bacterium]